MANSSFVLIIIYCYFDKQHNAKPEMSNQIKGNYRINSSNAVSFLNPVSSPWITLQGLPVTGDWKRVVKQDSRYLSQVKGAPLTVPLSRLLGEICDWIYTDPIDISKATETLLSAYKMHSLTKLKYVAHFFVKIWLGNWFACKI